MKLTKQDLKEQIGQWVQKETKIQKIDERTWEIETLELDSYGDPIYCFVTEIGKYYEVSDDSRILFKLDPGVEDLELYQTAEEIALGAGYDFDQDNATISVITDFDSLVRAIHKLSLLQVAISYLN